MYWKKLHTIVDKMQYFLRLKGIEIVANVWREIMFLLGLAGMA